MLLPDDFGIELICPDCRRPLARIDQFYLCSDGECRRAYPIVDQIPKLLVEDAEVLEPARWHSHWASRGDSVTTPTH